MQPTRQSVYLIDDDFRIRRGLSELLSAHGYQIITFGSAEEYLSWPKCDRVACLLLDMNLPYLSGLDLQRRLATETAPPIIFMTGYGDIPSAVTAMKAGAVEFLTKPLDETKLLIAIETALEQDRVHRVVRADIDEVKARFATLTPREAEVLPLIVAGYLNKQAASILGISEITLQVHRSRVLRKMQAYSVADLVRFAAKLGREIPLREVKGSLPS